MGDYISRDEAIERIQPHVKPQTVYGEGYLQAIEHATAILELMPAADVQPVRHGRWIDHERFERKNCNVCIECSVCNTWFGHDCIPKTKFCPNCSARMDLKDGDTE